MSLAALERAYVRGSVRAVAFLPADDEEEQAEAETGGASPPEVRMRSAARKEKIGGGTSCLRWGLPDDRMTGWRVERSAAKRGSNLEEYGTRFFLGLNEMLMLAKDCLLNLSRHSAIEKQCIEELFSGGVNVIILGDFLEIFINFHR